MDPKEIGVASVASVEGPGKIVENNKIIENQAIVR